MTVTRLMSTSRTRTLKVLLISYAVRKNVSCLPNGHKCMGGCKGRNMHSSKGWVDA